MTVAPVAEGDLSELLPLMRAYCDFYESSPADEGLLEMARTMPRVQPTWLMPGGC